MEEEHGWYEIKGNDGRNIIIRKNTKEKFISILHFCCTECLTAFFREKI
jgi:hypothetical protein